KADYHGGSDVLTRAAPPPHINKHGWTVPFVRGARHLGEAWRRIAEGAAMIRTKGEAGTGNIVEATTHIRTVMADIRRLHGMADDELFAEAKNMGAPYELVADVARTGKLPVVNFAAGGVATPSD